MSGSPDGHTNAGFTLLEMMIALGLFTVVLLASVGLLKDLLLRLKEVRGPVTVQTRAERLLHDLQRSRAILSISNRELLLWESDRNENEQPDPSETIVYTSEDNVLNRNGQLYYENLDSFSLVWNRQTADFHHVILEMETEKFSVRTGVFRE